jgi:hypothetical protein
VVQVEVLSQLWGLRQQTPAALVEDPQPQQRDTLVGRQALLGITSEALEDLEFFQRVVQPEMTDHPRAPVEVAEEP